MAKDISEEEKLEIKNMIDSLVERAKKASEEYVLYLNVYCTVVDIE